MELVLNSLLPVLGLLGVGVVLKRLDLTGAAFFKASDRLVYFLFFPVMLFWKIGGTPWDGSLELTYCLAGLISVTVVFLLSLLLIRLARISDFAAGSFSQSAYRFNSYIGMAVVINALGIEGVRYYGILISLSIPMINVMAVSTLIWYSGRRIEMKDRLRMLLRALVVNPLILACVAGILYAVGVGRFPVFLQNTFSLMTSAALPLALISIGGTLTFTGIRGHLKASLIAAVLKLVALPLIGFGLLVAFQVGGLPFRVTMVFFALPTATSIYILSSQLNSDTELASASIMLSTCLSFIPLSIALVI
jgi:predicted permease